MIKRFGNVFYCFFVVCAICVIYNTFQSSIKYTDYDSSTSYYMAFGLAVFGWAIRYILTGKLTIWFDEDA